MTLEDWTIKCSGLSREEYYRQLRAFRRREMLRVIGRGILTVLAYAILFIVGYLFLAVA